MQSLSDLMAALGGGAEAVKPPVHLWNPTRCGDIGMEILADGSWLHEGQPIRREALVRLFASILRKDPDGYWLVTPAEKVSVKVQDAPFLAVRAERVGEGRAQQIAFVTNVGDAVPLDGEHPLRLATAQNGEPRPYVRVRGGPGSALEALLVRRAFYDLVDWGEEREGGYGLWSGGLWWRLG